MKKYKVNIMKPMKKIMKSKLIHRKKQKKFLENESILVQKMDQSSAATVGVM